MNDLVISITGQVTHTNFNAWREQMLARIASVKTELATDEDFAEAQEQVKNFKVAEKALDEAKVSAQKQSADIHQLFHAIDQVKARIRETRLTLNRQVTARKALVKNRLIDDAIDEISSYVQETDSRFKVLKPQSFCQRHEFEAAIKGASTITTAKNKLQALIDEKKEEVDQRIQCIELNAKNLERIPEAYTFLFPDNDQLLAIQPSSALVALIEKRMRDYRESRPVPPRPPQTLPDPCPPIPTAPSPPKILLLDLLNTIAQGINPVTQQKFEKEEFEDFSGLSETIGNILKLISQEGQNSLPPQKTEPLEYDKALFEKLREWRLKITREKGLPPHFVSSNETFTEIARKAEQIRTAEDLLLIHGIGEQKLSEYGTDLFAIIREHVQEKLGIIQDENCECEPSEPEMEEPVEEIKAPKRTKEELNQARDKVNQENGWPARHNYPWGQKEIASVKELFLKNLSFVEIAKQMRRSPRSIALRLKKMGLVSEVEAESLKNFYIKHEEIDSVESDRPVKHDAATIEDIIGRNPREEILENHYEVTAAADGLIGGTREDTKKHRARNYSDMIHRS